MAQITEEIKAKAEVYRGDDALCQEKTRELLREIDMPEGLLPLKDIEECGYDRESGIVWMKQKNKRTHKFEKIKRNVSYDTEITAVVEKHRIKKLTGVKTRELMIWVTLSDIYYDNPPTEKLNFKTPTGLHKKFPASAFAYEYVKETGPEGEGVDEADDAEVDVKEV